MLEEGLRMYKMSSLDKASLHKVGVWEGREMDVEIVEEGQGG